MMNSHGTVFINNWLMPRHTVPIFVVRCHTRYFKVKTSYSGVQTYKVRSKTCILGLSKRITKQNI